MLERFVLWLTMKFVTNNKLVKHFVERVFKVNPLAAMHAIYRHMPADGSSMLSLTNDIALRVNPLNCAVKMLTLDSLATKLVCCTVGPRGEVVKFFERVIEIQKIPNRLQAMKQMRQHVFANTTFTSEYDIDLTAFVLLNQYFDATSCVEYVITKKGN